MVCTEILLVPLLLLSGFPLTEALNEYTWGHDSGFRPEVDTTTYEGIILPDVDDTLHSSGRVTGFGYHVNKGTFYVRLVIFRPSGFCFGCTFQSYEIVARSEEFYPSTTSGVEYNEPSADMTFQSGDTIGIQFVGDNPIAYEDQNCFDFGTSAPLRYYDTSVDSTWDVGNFKSFEVLNVCRQYSLYVDYVDEICLQKTVADQTILGITLSLYIYESDYENDKCWTIRTSENANFVKLVVQEWVLSGCSDSITVYDGESPEYSSQLYTFCDSGYDHTLFSRGNVMSVKFRSYGQMLATFSATAYSSSVYEDTSFNDYNYGYTYGSSYQIDYVALYISLGVIGGLCVCGALIGGIVGCAGGCGKATGERWRNRRPGEVGPDKGAGQSAVVVATVTTAPIGQEPANIAPPPYEPPADANQLRGAPPVATQYPGANSARPGGMTPLDPASTTPAAEPLDQTTGGPGGSAEPPPPAVYIEPKPRY